MSLNNRKLVRTVQIVLGLGLVFFGFNALFQFAETPQFNEAAAAFLGALFVTGYVFPIMGVVWIVSGALFVFNKYSPLAAILIFPFSLNILLFHLFLDFSGALGGIIMFILNIYLIGIHWNNYKPMCK